MSFFLQASRMLKVPTRLLLRNGSGLAMLRSTWISAAKWTTKSAFFRRLLVLELAILALTNR